MSRDDATTGTAPVNSTGPSQDNNPLLEITGEFILHLIQAFLRTGYYLPDHPEAKKSKAGLYERFAEIADSAGEITFLIKEEGGQKVIFIEGISDTPLRLIALMTRGMAETYNPRFVQFLDRKELLSLSLNRRMAGDEFSHFIDFMSEPTLADLEEQSGKEQFVTELRRRGICNLSFVFREDFITIRTGVPWRTRMALSRLKKDIHMLPIFRNLGEEDFRRIKHEILVDILRPLRVAELIYSFLLNIDLAASSSLSEEDGEDGVFAVVSEDVLLAVANHFVEDASGKGAGFPDYITRQKKARLLGKICHRLNQSQKPLAGELLEKMFNLGLLSLEELSPHLKERIMAIKWMTNYLHNPAKYLNAVDETVAVATYESRGRIVARIIPLLIERAKIDEAIAIVLLFSGHSREDSPRAAVAGIILSAIAEGPSLAAGASQFLEASKEIRTVIGSYFVIMGERAIPHLLGILSQTNDLWRRKQAVEILISLGTDAAHALMNELEEEKLPFDSIMPVLRLLGGITDETLKAEAVRILKLRSDDPLPTIRAEVLAALSHLDPKGQFELSRKNLANPDSRVKKAAVRGIGLSGDQRSFACLTEIIEKEHKNRGEAEWALVAMAVDALGTLMETYPAIRNELFSYLAQLVDQACPQGAWKRLLVPSGGFPAVVVLALVEILGRRTREESGGLLARLARHRDRAVAARASELLRLAQDSAPVKN